MHSICQIKCIVKHYREGFKHMEISKGLLVPKYTNVCREPRTQLNGTACAYSYSSQDTYIQEDISLTIWKNIHIFLQSICNRKVYIKTFLNFKDLQLYIACVVHLQNFGITYQCPTKRLKHIPIQNTVFHLHYFFEMWRGSY